MDPLQVLILEDRPEDAELMLRELRRAGFDLTSERVDTAEGFLAQLETHPDIILADYSMPGFDGMSALHLLQKSNLDIPFILVSGTIGEELAVTAIKAGAADYLLKDRLTRLGSVVARVLEEKRLRAEKQRAEDQLRRAQARLANILEHAAEAILAVNHKQDIVSYNLAAEKMFGYTVEEILGQPLDLLIPESLLEIHCRHFQDFASSTEPTIPMEHGPGLNARRKDGSVFPVEIGISRLVGDGEELYTAIIVDITERKRAEETLRESEERFSRLAQASFEGIAIHDASGILDANQPLADLFGYELSEMIGMSPPDLAAPESRALIRKNILANLEKPYEAIGLRKDGTTFACELLVKSMRYKGSIVRVTAIRDITERKRAEEQINRQLEQLQSLRTIDLAISNSLDLRLTLRILLEQVAAQLKADAAEVMLLDQFTQMLVPAGQYGFRHAEVERARVPVGEGIAGHAALERTLKQVPDLEHDSEKHARAEYLAVEGFVSYYSVPLIAKGWVKGVLNVFHRRQFHVDAEWLNFLGALAEQTAIAVDNAELFENLQRSNSELRLAYDTTLEGWSKALDLRDKETEGHTQRVTETTEKLARALGMSEEALVEVRRGGLLHDIGKMGVPDSILLKPGPLTEEEWVVMRKHPVHAFEMLAPITYLHNALDIPYCHHEKWDGTGYPRGLRGEAIPFAARIFAVVDVWDAVRSDRPYRKAWKEEQAIEHIRKLSGTHFDPRVVDTFLQMINEE